MTREGSSLRFRDVRLPLIAADRCSHLLLFVEAAGSEEWPSLFLLPIGGEISTSTVVPRMGLRVDSRVDVKIPDLSVGDRELLAGGRDAAVLLERLITATAAGMAARAVGLAARAHQLSFEYCQTRVQGGKPIIQHQSVAEVLWRTQTAIETSRQTVRGLAVAADEEVLELGAALMARTMAAKMVISATVEMTELLGGYGVTTEYPLEKLYRDAQTLVTPTGRVEGEGVFAPVSLS